MSLARPIISLANLAKQSTFCQERPKCTINHWPGAIDQFSNIKTLNYV